ncbi:MAG: hypothetical protein K6T83_24095, partial [Alicyclobacillus sp.]|nr:hypothetical protein [Alicyclobacillus sp.]
FHVTVACGSAAYGVSNRGCPKRGKNSAAYCLAEGRKYVLMYPKTYTARAFSPFVCALRGILL